MGDVIPDPKSIDENKYRDALRDLKALITKYDLSGTEITLLVVDMLVPYRAAVRTQEGFWELMDQFKEMVELRYMTKTFGRDMNGN